MRTSWRRACCNINPDAADTNATLGTVPRPLVGLALEDLCPGDAALQSLMDEYR